jgi:hypothetical protein
MDDDYDSYGIAIKTWFAAKGDESHKNSYYVRVEGWHYDRRIIKRDGLISLQVTVHCQDRCCYTCKERVCFVQQQLANHNVQCFWTCEPENGSLYVTVGPPPPGTSAEIYLMLLLELGVIRCTSLKKAPTKQRKAKGGSRKRRHIIQ